MKTIAVKYSVLCLLLACNVMVLSAQSKRVLKHEASKALAKKDWNAAAQCYKRLYSKDSANLAIKYKYAEISVLNYELDLATKLFLSITNTDHGEKFPLSFYQLGQLYKSKEQYKEAKAWFNRFSKLNYSGEKSDYYKTKTNLELEACDWAFEEIKKKKKLQVDHVSQSINSKSNEFAAVERDSVLYYSSAKFPDRKSDEEETVYHKIYRAEFKNKKWQKIRALDTSINKTNFHQANAAFNADNSLMVLSRCTMVNASDYVCHLYLSKKVKNKWQEAVQLNSNINEINSTNTQANFATINNKTVLFFASNRAGGEGGMDIWYAHMNDTGGFEKAVNAGKAINTPDDEITPWFDNKTNSLYFSSNYHKGLGGFDIFKSTFNEPTFSTVQNLGYPINSSHNDVYYSLNSTGSKIYLSSNRVGSYFENKINCCNDIYRIHIDTVKTPPIKAVEPPPVKKDTLVVMKEQLKLLVPLTLYFNNDEPDPRTKNIRTDKNYENLYYEYSRYSQMYANEYSKGLQGDAKEMASEEMLNFFSDSLENGFDQLKRFTEMLQKVLLNGETVKLTFKGYCSPLASSDYNINLAKRRVSSLRNYFNEYKNGWFVKYFNNPNEKEGKIIFEEVDIGELTETKASDDYKDKRNSVFSPKAASERKIQILAIQFGN